MSIQKITTDIIEDSAITGSKISVGTPEAGDIFYYDGTEYVKLSKGTDGDELILENGLPVWGTSSASSESTSSSTSGNAWLFGGTIASLPAKDLLYYSFNSDGHQVVGTANTWGGSSVDRVQQTIVVNSSTHSWLMGGITSSTVADVTEKFAFASATDSANPTTLSHVGDCAGRFFNIEHIGCQSSTAGYCAGGRDFEGVARITNSRKVDFSNDNVSSLPGAADMSTNRFGHRCANNSTHALYAGGRTSDSNNNGQSNLTLIDRFTFASESMQGNWDDLSIAMEGGSQSSNETHAFYHGGTQLGGLKITTIERFTFASQNSGTDHGSLVRNVSLDEGAQNTTHGFSVGGIDNDTGTSVEVSDVNAYAFANNTTTVKTADLQIAISGTAGCQPPTF